MLNLLQALHVDLYTTGIGLFPRAYGLPKIHKSNCPFRIIVSWPSIKYSLIFIGIIFAPYYDQWHSKGW